jgi:hypothetical protein
LLHLSGYAQAKWADSSSDWHGRHIAEAITAERQYQDGTMGAAYATTFLNALDAVQQVIDRALKAGDLPMVLKAAMVTAEIGETQARVDGALPQKGAKPTTTPPLTARARLSPEEAKQALEDYEATKLNGSPPDSAHDPPARDS